MSVLIPLLLVVHVVVCLLIVFLVLLQRPKQEGLGVAFGGGMADQFMGAQASNILQRGTVYLAVVLFIVTFILSILYTRKHRNSKASVADLAGDTPALTTPASSEGGGGKEGGEPGIVPITPQAPAGDAAADKGGDAAVTPGISPLKPETPLPTPAPAPAPAVPDAPGAGETPAPALPTPPAPAENPVSGALEGAGEAVEGAAEAAGDAANGVVEGAVEKVEGLLEPAVPTPPAPVPSPGN